MISAYALGISAFQLDRLNASVTGNEEDSTLELYIGETGVVRIMLKQDIRVMYGETK